MIVCTHGFPGQGMSYEPIPRIANQHQEPATMKLTTPTYDNLKEPISKEELVAGLLISGYVSLVDAKLKARDRNLTIRIRANARAAA